MESDSRPAISFQTLGCKLNQAESESMARQAAAAGYLVTSGETAEVCVINTCTVTHVADRKARQLVRQARRANPTARIILTGCYADRAPQDLVRTGLVDLLLPNKDKDRLSEFLSAAPPFPSHTSLSFPKAEGQLGHIGNLPRRTFPLVAPVSVDSAPTALLPNSRVRAMLKIQDGCRANCAYCIVPLVRNVVTSVPADIVIQDINARVSEGYREAVLTGTEIGAYRSNGDSLSALVRRILAETGIDRLRLSSLQPQEITTDLLSLSADSRLCPHFHLALQSGCDATLKRMRRRYSIDQFVAALRRIRQALPDAAVTTDVIVGFPGETDSDFEGSLEFCEQAGFAAIHVFPFSPRPGTEAAKMEGTLPATERLRRSRRFLAMAGRARTAFRQTFAGRTMAVLWEKETVPGSGVYTGLTGNYLRVIAPSSTSVTNQIRTVRLTGISGDALSGQLA